MLKFAVVPSIVLYFDSVEKRNMWCLFCYKAMAIYYDNFVKKPSPET